jgi:hypothetical protein
MINEIVKYEKFFTVGSEKFDYISSRLLFHPEILSDIELFYVEKIIIYEACNPTLYPIEAL